MDAKLQRRVQRYGWDKAVPDYEDGWKRSLWPAHQALMDSVGTCAGARVLDLAAGTGLVTFPLADMVGTTGHVVATDISGSMTDILETEVRRRNIPNIDVSRMDAEDLSAFSDGSFDIVTSGLGLMYLPHPEVALKEAMRVLKSDGRAVFAVWGARKNCGWADIFPIVDERVKSAVCPLFFRLGTGDTLRQMMEDAAFRNVKAKRVHTLMPYASDEHALKAAFSGGPVALAYDRFGDAVKKEVHAAYLASIEPFKKNTGYLIPGEFVVVAGDC